MLSPSNSVRGVYDLHLKWSPILSGFLTFISNHITSHYNTNITVAKRSESLLHGIYAINFLNRMNGSLETMNIRVTTNFGLMPTKLPFQTLFWLFCVIYNNYRQHYWHNSYKTSNVTRNENAKRIKHSFHDIYEKCFEQYF